MSNRGQPLAAAACLVLLLAGCTLGPDVKPPEMPLPDAFSPPLPEATAAAAADVAWWQGFGDAYLDRLIERALIANRDLERAVAVIAEARALRTQAAASFYPQVDGGASVTRRRQTTTGASGGFGTAGVGSADRSSIDTFYEAGFDAAWELDVFGKTRRAVEAAEAGINAETDAVHAVRLTLIGDVARAYVDARGLQQRIKVTEATIAAQRDTVGLTRARFQAGTGNGLDAVRAEAQLASFAAELPPLRAAFAADVHRLGVLTGQEPRALADVLAPPAPIPTMAATPEAGVPAALLRRRPDIREAEQRLAQATANIGVAVAERYPTFSLPGTISLTNTKLIDLFRKASLIWAIGPDVSVPLFDGGFRRAEVELRYARQAQARAAWEQTVLIALEEVENALASWREEADRHRALVASADGNADALALATELYTRGLASFLDVLDAQRALFQAQSALAASEAALTTDLVALYKALGGGWAADPAVAAAAEGS
ncbi:MAG: efflux transporter outer membrane subunit [Rhodospirillales bacterium]|nr:efflux transporter outer membrane subunit [Rhodospirillales bacterium]